MTKIKNIELLTKYEIEVLRNNLERLRNDSRSPFFEAGDDEFRVNQKPFTLGYIDSIDGPAKGRVICSFVSKKEEELLDKSSINLINGKEYLLEDSDGQRTKVYFERNGFMTRKVAWELNSDKLYRGKNKYLILIRIPSLNFHHCDNSNRISFFGCKSNTKVLDLQGNLVWKGETN
jgi:hypothetical protein